MGLLIGLLLFLLLASPASAKYSVAEETSGVFYADLGITIVGPPDMRKMILDALDDMPSPWKDYVLEHIRGFRQIEDVPWEVGTWQDEVRVHWPSEQAYQEGGPPWLFQAALVHEARHIDDWKRCLILGGPASEARSLYLQAEYFFNIAWDYYPGWRDYIYDQGKYYAGLAGQHGKDQPWRILRRDCAVAYDPLSLRPIPILSDWVRN